MPRDATMLPRHTRIVGLILAFAPLFVFPLRRRAQILLAGAIPALAHKCGERPAAHGLAQERRFVNAHRISNRAARRPRSGSCILFVLLVEVFARPGLMDPGLDKTVERRCGKLISADGLRECEAAFQSNSPKSPWLHEPYAGIVELLVPSDPDRPG